jgi:hypothetical protein
LKNVIKSVFHVNQAREFMFFCWTPWTQITTWTDAMKSDGWFKTVELVVWHKQGLPLPTNRHGWFTKSEFALLGYSGEEARSDTMYLFSNDDPRWNTVEFVVPRLFTNLDKSSVNICQKPVRMMSWVISHFSRPGQWVLDLCSGTGS